MARQKEWEAKVKEAEKEVIDFSTKVLGISSMHPNMDVNTWKPPYGNCDVPPPVNPLRANLEDMAVNDETLQQYYEWLVNRVNVHQCYPNFCLKEKRVEGPITGQVEHKLVCRHKFPFDLAGYLASYMNPGQSQQYKAVELHPNDKLRLPSGAAFEDGNLVYARNHPNTVTHCKELLPSMQCK